MLLPVWVVAILASFAFQIFTGVYLSTLLTLPTALIARTVWCRRQRDLYRLGSLGTDGKSVSGFNGGRTPERLERLRSHLGIAVEVLGADCTSSPAVRAPPYLPGSMQADARVELAKGLVRLCVRQYRLNMPKIAIRFVSEPVDYAGKIQQRGNVWRINLASAAVVDDRQLLSVVAHEIAHIVLQNAGVELAPVQANEELTDTVAVMAGFGRLMRSANFMTHHKVELLGSREIHTTLGYLPVEDIDFLWHVRERIAHKRPIRRFTPAPLPSSVLFDCYGCGTSSRLPDVSGTLKIRCRKCGLPHMVRVPRNRESSGWGRIAVFAARAVDEVRSAPESWYRSSV